MRVKRLREILDGPFLLAEDHHAVSPNSEKHLREGIPSRPQSGESVNDRAERKD